MKPTGRKSYGSIPHLSNSKLGPSDYHVNFGMERILTERLRDRHDKIIVHEKYDGSNVGIAKVNGKIFPLTRSGYLASTSPYIQHHKFSDWVFSKEKLFNSLLSNGDRICGEYMAQAHGILYNISTDPILFFDFFKKDERMLQDELIYWLHQYELNTPRLIHSGGPVKTSQLINILNERSTLIKSVELPEGMVYRVERKNKVEFLAKWVRSDFESGKYLKGKEVWNV